MAISIITHLSNAASGSITLGPTNTLTADFFFAGVTWYNGASPVFTFTDDQGNTWTLASTTTAFSGASIYRCIPTTKNANHNFTSNPSLLAYQVFDLFICSGVHQSSPILLEAGSSATSAQISMQTLVGTPSEDNCLCVTTGTTVTSSTPLTCDVAINQYITQYSGGVNDSGGTCYTIQTTAASFQPTWLWPSAAEGSMRTAFIRAAAVSSNPYLLVKN